MKSKVINILFFCYVLSTTVNAVGQPADSITGNDLIDIWIAQSERREHIVKLYIQNQQSDTIALRSSFYIDEPKYPSYILVNRCIQINVDSIYCTWDMPLDISNPIRIEYGDKWLYIPPKQIVYMEIPIRRNYVEYEVYFEVRFLLLYKRKSFRYMKESNKIYMERYNKRNKQE
jgi:hypothetical protein